MNILILTDDDKMADGRYRLVDQRAIHIREILKLRAGDKIRIGLLCGPLGEGTIETISSREVILAINALASHPPNFNQPKTTLICALPRPQTLKKILLTSAMMGVRILHLIRAARVEKSYFHSPLLKPEKYGPFLLEGLSQTGLTCPPEVQIHTRFRGFLKTIEDTCGGFQETDCLRLLPEKEAPATLPAVYQSHVKNIAIAVGPEGGWLPYEIESMEDLGFRRFSLGPWTLRVEHAVTATLAQVSLVQAMLFNK